MGQPKLTGQLIADSRQSHCSAQLDRLPGKKRVLERGMGRADRLWDVHLSHKHLSQMVGIMWHHRIIIT